MVIISQFRALLMTLTSPVWHIFDKSHTISCDYQFWGVRRILCLSTGISFCFCHCACVKALKFQEAKETKVNLSKNNSVMSHYVLQ